MTITPVTSGTEILSFTANTHAHRSCGISKDTEVLSTKKKKKRKTLPPLFSTVLKPKLAPTAG